MDAIEGEAAETRRLFDRLERTEQVACRIQSDYPQEAAELLALCRAALADTPPVRVQAAALLLKVSATTVRGWVRDGLLRRDPAGDNVRVLDPVRLREVARLADALREHVHDADLCEALWQRLSDDAVLGRIDLAESLAQMRAGELAPARTRGEQLGEPADQSPEPPDNVS